MPVSQPLPSRLIGALFVDRALVSESQIRIALEIQNETGQQLGQILVERFGVSRKELASVVAEQWAKLGGSSGPEDTASWRRLGEIFVERGFVNQEELEQALARQRQTGERLGEALVAQGVISKFELAGALAEQMAALEGSAAADTTEDAVPEATVHHLPARPDDPSDSAPATVLELVPSEQNSSELAATVEPSSEVSEPAEVEHAVEPEPEELPLPQIEIFADVGAVPDPEEPVVEDAAFAEPTVDDMAFVEEPGVEDVVFAEPTVEHVAFLEEPAIDDVVFAERTVEDVGFAQAPVHDDIAFTQPSVACVAFAPTTGGYRLVPLDAVPVAGETIDVPDVGFRLVLRVGRSPYPLDDQMCAFVEEPVTPALVEALAH